MTVFIRVTVPPCKEHGAARDGTVPLCGDDIWNPQLSLASPNSGLMKQPTKEGPFSELPK